MFLANLPRLPCDSYGSGFRDLALVLAATSPSLPAAVDDERGTAPAHAIACGPGGGLLCGPCMREHPPHPPPTPAPSPDGVPWVRFWPAAAYPKASSAFGARTC